MEQSSALSLSLDTLDCGTSRTGIVGRSHAIGSLIANIERLAAFPTTVLVHGETGTGKELVARALHSSRPAPHGPLVIFNCSNLVSSLAESQLFGHVRGAFTDAREDSPGLFRAAGGGTLFLDEIGELPMSLQAKLLRAIETREIQPVGSMRSYHVDFRLVAATNRDLREMVSRGEFRADLFYRLGAIALNIAPLRERKEDIPVLIAHFVRLHGQEMGHRPSSISGDALAALIAYQWPGNIRELGNVVAATMLNCDGDRIALEHLPPFVFASEQKPRVEPLPQTDQLGAQTIGETVRMAVLKCLEQTRGNRSRAAEILGISRSTLYRILARGERGLDDEILVNS